MRAILLCFWFLTWSQGVVSYIGVRIDSRQLIFARRETLWAKPSRSRGQQQQQVVGVEEETNVELTRSALVAIIDDSWRQVRTLVSPVLLKQCEDELKGATSLLVLATVRKAADANPESRATVEGMFREADKDGDGQITFLEWFEWVSQDAAYFGNDHGMGLGEDEVGRAPQAGQEDSFNMRSRQISKRRQRQRQQKTVERFEARQVVKERRMEQLDPMVTGLAQVLGHAVCTLQVAARLPNEDASYLAAAFVAGGTMAGAMDETLTRTMLSRLSPRTRDLVALALTLEAASMATDSNFEGGMGAMLEEYDAAQAKTMPGVSEDMVYGDEDDVESIVDADGAYVEAVEEASSATPPPLDVIQTVDLSSIPIKTAPSIDEPAPPIEQTNFYGRGPTGVDKVDIIGDDEVEVVVKGSEKEADLEIELKESREFFGNGNDRSGASVNSWKVEDDEIVESNQFDVKARPTIHVGKLVDTSVHESESVTVDNVLSSTVMPLSNSDSQHIVTTIANAPPEKDEKLIILQQQQQSLDGAFEGAVGVYPDSDEWPEVEVMSGPASVEVMGLGGDREEVFVADGGVVGQSSDRGQPQYGLMLNSGGLDSTLEKAGSIAADITALRSAFKDMDDSQSQLMRHLIMRKSGGRADILGLSMALRVCRLQNAGILGLNSKNRLAMETLQLWAPISFQIGINTKLPELEVHSYVLLFPKSFSSFINWYTAFRPIAKKVLSKFQMDLEDALLADPVIPRFASKVLIQSRLKSPSSAFKKMVKSDSKQRHQLYDMLGVRVIITDRPLNPMEPMVSDYFDMNVYETVNTECDFDFDEIEEGKEGFSEEEEQDDLRISLVRSGNTAEIDDGVFGPRGRVTQDYESRVVSYVKDLILALPRWGNDQSRFKDYVTRPKASGYQSMHMTLVHAATGVNLEVQLRSARMHMEAEYGRASHSSYKAMMLPASVDQQQDDDMCK